MCVANLVTARAAIVQHRPGRPAIPDIKNAHTPVAIRQPVYAQKELNTGVPLDIMAHPAMVRPGAAAVPVTVHPLRAQRQSRRVICRLAPPAATAPGHIHIRLIVITVTSNKNGAYAPFLSEPIRSCYLYIMQLYRVIILITIIDTELQPHR